MSARRSKSATAYARRSNLESLESRTLFAIVVAEDLLVNVDVTGRPEGPATSIPNAGSLGGVFETTSGDAGTVPVIDQPVATATSGTVGIRMDGNDFLQLLQTAGGTDLLAAPTGITGANATASVEAWVWNPAVATEETMVAWGRRGGPDGTNSSFNYGTSGNFGAVGHWGTPDIGWGAAFPAARQWHHLVYTYDGTTTRVYIDGAMTNSESLPISPEPDTPINIGAQTNPVGAVEPALRGNLTLGRVRIHDGVLSDADILANYNAEKADFIEPVITPPPPPPLVKLVDVDPTALPEGPITDLTNTGTVDGLFRATGPEGTAPVIGKPLDTATTGTVGIRMDGTDFLQHVTAADGSLVPAPASLVGVNPQASIEVWAWNPAIAAEETMVAWAHRGGPDGTNMSFNYGSNGAFGAVGHWGSPDMGWGTVPAAQHWHHLVYTFDGLTTRVYADGVLANSELLGEGALNIYPNDPISIGTQIAQGGAPEPGVRGSLTLGRVRVYSGTLTDAQILADYNAEKANYVEPGFPPPPDPIPLTAAPVHRYSFNEPAGDASGDQITDSIGTAHGTVIGALEGSTTAPPTWTGTRLALPGGSSATAPYGDLPNGLLSGYGAASNGPGMVSIEGWIHHTGNQNWSRFFDFGSSTAGELQGPGGTGTGTGYLMLSAQMGGDTATHRFELNRNAGDPDNRTADVFGSSFNADLHFVVTWQEATTDPDSGAVTPGQLKLYQQGVEVASFTTPILISDILDVNNWLGRSQYTTDSNFQGEFDEFRIYDHVLTPGEVRGDFLAGADVVNTAAARHITNVYAKGSTWQAADSDAGTTTFMEYLGSHSLGSSAYGDLIPSRAAGSEDILPWINVNQLVLEYDGALTAAPAGGGMVVHGVRRDYNVTTTLLDPTHVLLTLDQPFGGNPASTATNGDRISLTVPGAGPGGPGGANYQLKFNVVQGDVNKSGSVLANDFSEVKARFFQNSNQAAYSPFHDVDGSGSILANDFSAVKARFFQGLPAAAAPAVALAGSSVTRDLFSSASIL